MVLTKLNFCEEADNLLYDGKRSPGSILLTFDSANYNLFLNFLTSELKELPFNNEVGETVYMRHDAKEVVDVLVNYLSAQSSRLNSGEEWSTDLKHISKVYETPNFQVFKNIVRKGTKISGTCYSLDLCAALDNKGWVPDSFTLDRFFAKSELEELIVEYRGSLTLSYTGRINIDTYKGRIPNIHL